MAHIAYLQQRLAQWTTGSDMDALLRAADHIDLLSPDERKVWEVDDDRADELAEAIQEAIDSDVNDEAETFAHYETEDDGDDADWLSFAERGHRPEYLSDGSRWA